MPILKKKQFGKPVNFSCLTLINANSKAMKKPLSLLVAPAVAFCLCLSGCHNSKVEPVNGANNSAKAASNTVTKTELGERTENLTPGKIMVSTPNGDGSYTVTYDSASAQAKELMEFAEAVERGEKSIEDAPEINR